MIVLENYPLVDDMSALVILRPEEVTADSCEQLKSHCADESTEYAVVRHQECTTRKQAKGSPQQGLLVVRGIEDGKSTAVAVRDSWFKAIRRDCFVLQDVGTYTSATVRRHAFNRLMFCTMKCRSHYFDDAFNDEPDEIGIAVAHLHSGCACKRNTTRGMTYQAFWDKLAEGIVKYCSRVLCIDANMALWCVAPELRARGVMISMAGLFLSTRMMTMRLKWTPSASSSLDPQPALGWHILPRSWVPLKRR